MLKGPPLEIPNPDKRFQMNPTPNQAGVIECQIGLKVLAGNALSLKTA